MANQPTFQYVMRIPCGENMDVSKHVSAVIPHHTTIFKQSIHNDGSCTILTHFIRVCSSITGDQIARLHDLARLQPDVVPGLQEILDDPIYQIISVYEYDGKYHVAHLNRDEPIRHNEKFFRVRELFSRAIEHREWMERDPQEFSRESYDVLLDAIRYILLGDQNMMFAKQVIDVLVHETNAPRRMIDRRGALYTVISESGYRSTTMRHLYG